MTKYYLNDIEISQEDARKYIPVSIAEEVVILREMTSQEKEEYTNSLIVSKIREKYTLNDELAILRQRDTKPQEFAEYNEFVEHCKAEVKGLQNGED